jgi:hypothetical protein
MPDLLSRGGGLNDEADEGNWKGNLYVYAIEEVMLGLTAICGWIWSSSVAL